MISVPKVLLALTVASAVWATIAAYRMGSWLSHHGVKVNWFWYRATMPWYVHRYQKMTKESDGRAGPLYTQFIIAINLAMVLAVATLVLIAIARR
jgi:hypothetical protein